MKMPSTCPCCQGVMINSYTGRHQENLMKRCTQILNHKIMFKAKSDNHDEVSWVSMKLDSSITIFWHPDDKLVKVESMTGSLSIPYFEPDFSNYNKLINKLKTYLVFS